MKLPASKTFFLGLGALLVILGAGGYVSSKRTSGTDQGQNSKSTQSHPTYKLNLTNINGSANFPLFPEANELRFDIRDQDNTVLKDFEPVYEKQMHLIVVRKDRTNFQHIHPTFEKATGRFVITNLQFPTDGEYRLFADFIPRNAQMDSTGNKLPITLYYDIKAGNLSKYKPVTFGNDNTASNVNGFQTDLVLISHDSATASLVNGIPQLIGVNINKDKQPFKRLQLYHGALGHMVVLGPNLEFIRAVTMSDDLSNQSGLIPFKVTFPDPGQYKLFLQTQVNDQVMTTDYTLTVTKNPADRKQGSLPM